LHQLAILTGLIARTKPLWVIIAAVPTVIYGCGHSEPASQRPTPPAEEAPSTAQLLVPSDPPPIQIPEVLFGGADGVPINVEWSFPDEYYNYSVDDSVLWPKASKSEDIAIGTAKRPTRVSIRQFKESDSLGIPIDEPTVTECNLTAPSGSDCEYEPLEDTISVHVKINPDTQYLTLTA